MTGWLLAAIACGGILFSVLGSTDRITAPLRSRPLVYLGRISYGLYVYHELVLKLADRLFPRTAVRRLSCWNIGYSGCA
jgi:peptidoglycan/LPS O-acetylase OafA/YrhL